MSIKCRSCNQHISEPDIIMKKYPTSLWPCSKRLSKKNLNLEVYYCKNCSLIQLQRFKDKKIKNFYSNDSKVLNDNVSLIKRFNKIKNFVENKKEIRILEIGGGRNNVLKFFTNPQKWLCDFDIDNVQKNINLINTDFKNFKDKKKFFNYIFFFHTLEHIQNPKNFLLNASNQLRDNGKIILEVPNIRYYLKEYPTYAFFFQHQSMFSLNSLRNLLSNCNLKFDEIISKKSDSFILAIVSKSNKRKSLIKKEKNILSRISLKIDKKLDVIKKLIFKYKIKNIAMYGCGGASMTFFYHLQKNNIQIDDFYDNDKRKINQFIPKYNKKVISGNKFNFKCYDLIITTNNNVKSFLKKKNKLINIISLQ